MIASRDVFLERVRRALEAGKRAGHATVLEPRGATGYQGAGSDLAVRFCEQLVVAGGQAHRVPDAEGAAALVLELVESRSAKRVALAGSPLVTSLRLAERMEAAGMEVISMAALSPENGRDPLFAADVGISVADFLIAETGTVVLRACQEEPRSISLLPPLHLVIAERARLVPDLFDLFDPGLCGEDPRLPSCLTLITGPSKTGDIELRLVTGVHGPGELHVVLMDT